MSCASKLILLHKKSPIYQVVFLALLSVWALDLEAQNTRISYDSTETGWQIGIQPLQILFGSWWTADMSWQRKVNAHRWTAFLGYHPQRGRQLFKYEGDLSVLSIRGGYRHYFDRRKIRRTFIGLQAGTMLLDVDNMTLVRYRTGGEAEQDTISSDDGLFWFPLTFVFGALENLPQREAVPLGDRRYPGFTLALESGYEYHNPYSGAYISISIYLKALYLPGYYQRGQTDFQWHNRNQHRFYWYPDVNFRLGWRF